MSKGKFFSDSQLKAIRAMASAGIEEIKNPYESNIDEFDRLSEEKYIREKLLWEESPRIKPVPVKGLEEVKEFIDGLDTECEVFPVLGTNNIVVIEPLVGVDLVHDKVREAFQGCNISRVSRAIFITFKEDNNNE
ncbi:hypothetical protein CloPEP1_0023 [Clostridium phage Clo-PEP-1]|nr:hypothetical protein CloPEP1_0023 [Clostridium phage Clo-PEP-1]